MSEQYPAYVVLIPSYNTGGRLFETIASARLRGLPVIVVIDGSTDGTGATLIEAAAGDAGLFASVTLRNEGKGAAILRGLRLAESEGFTHALTMDADGQHSTAHIGEMIATSRARPGCMVLGWPVFDAGAPRIRVVGHRVANFCTGLVTPRGAIADSLFGFRIYPIRPLLDVFASTPGMRRFDFDSEAAIRLCWRGVRPVNVATPVRYYRRDEGGVSHFKYLRDNLLLARMYVRLGLERVARAWPRRIMPGCLASDPPPAHRAAADAGVQEDAA